MPYAWVIIVILWWVISAANKSAQQKKKAQQAGSAAARPQKVHDAGTRVEKMFQTKQPASPKKADSDGWEGRGMPASPELASAPSPAAPAMSRRDDWEDEEENWDQRDAQRPRAAAHVQAAPARRHEAKPLEAHMHTPVMGTEGDGTEGIDCCHEFMLNQPSEEPADFLPLQEETENERAKALLQGVIYSEILGRRPVRRYGKRPA